MKPPGKEEGSREGGVGNAWVHIYAIGELISRSGSGCNQGTFLNQASAQRRALSGARLGILIGQSTSAPRRFAVEPIFCSLLAGRLDPDGRCIHRAFRVPILPFVLRFIIVIVVKNVHNVCYDIL